MRRLARVIVQCALGAICLAAFGRPVRAQENVRLFGEGNNHYMAGEFEEAAGDYRQLLAQGFRGAAIHYNLGNALYKMGKVGPAILEYEKAAILAPDDDDVRDNLEFVRSLTADKTTGNGAQTTSFFVERLLGLTTLDQDAAVMVGLYLLASALVAVRIVSSRPGLRRAALWGMAALALPLAVAAGGYGVKLYRAETTTHAIVLQERLDVRSGPGDDNTTLFTIHEGLKVRVRHQQGAWFQVSLENGLNGWVPSAAVGVI